MALIKQSIEWKDVKGFEGFYQINNVGKVYSCHSHKLLTAYESSDGYLRVNLSVRGKVKIKMLHVLVATAFLPNPQDLPVVNHIDGNKKNPLPHNLEWTTFSENSKHAFFHGLSKISDKAREKASENAKINGAKTTSRPVIQYSIDGRKIAVFSSIKEASRITGANDGRISHVCKRRKGMYTAGGFVWRYKDDPEFT
ncbi:NUMOD4 domain-containing protein [Marinilactibacillus psychrotolerans]|nr:NUMOD4 domain-containing protein [Marinilactibacillus psychrotolerans]